MSSKELFSVSELTAKIAPLKCHEMAVLCMKGNCYDEKASHLNHYAINEKAQRLGMIVRIQKYQDKFYVIRVA